MQLELAQLRIRPDRVSFLLFSLGLHGARLGFVVDLQRIDREQVPRSRQREKDSDPVRRRQSRHSAAWA